MWFYSRRYCELSFVPQLRLFVLCRLGNEGGSSGEGGLTCSRERFLSSGSEVWFLLACALERFNVQFSLRVFTSMLLGGSDCFVLGWGVRGVEQDNPHTVLP